MKANLISLAILIAVANTALAQSGIDNKVYAIEKTVLQVESVNESANKVKNVLGGLLGKKKTAKTQVEETEKATQATTPANTDQSKAKTVTPIEKTTIVSVSGLDYNKLKELEIVVKQCATVTASKRSLNINGSQLSTIAVSHINTSTDELMDMLMDKINGKFTVASNSDGAFTLAVVH